ncbi:hypothetical protein [Chitinophaga arvensicola]|uniref:Helix-turn-helix domain-containing protein n=1 Tax=Chitinophaga arvensicola TaxID=29529 RepID=A0A1I0PL18_9BACT|nr:hypothetical protein [Chitinophaga arvensicola]SEW15072.1 hypothetical protein SAMN04488122_0845 [Chitinophaga arvensicola]
MNTEKCTTFVILPESDLISLRKLMEDVRAKIDTTFTSNISPSREPDYILKAEFMAATGMKRSKFQELINSSAIKTVKKKRKVYVLASEINRYFTDPSIQ